MTGLTALEVLILMLVVGVLASVTVPRLADGRAFAERGYYEDLVSALDVSRRLAIASGCPVRLVIDAQGYRAHQHDPMGAKCSADGSWSVPVMLGGARRLAGAPPLGVRVSPEIVVVFDALGVPDLADDQTLSVGSLALTIKAHSGKLEAARTGAAGRKPDAS